MCGGGGKGTVSQGVARLSCGGRGLGPSGPPLPRVPIRGAIGSLHASARRLVPIYKWGRLCVTGWVVRASVVEAGYGHFGAAPRELLGGGLLGHVVEWRWWRTQHISATAGGSRRDGDHHGLPSAAGSMKVIRGMGWSTCQKFRYLHPNSNLQYLVVSTYFSVPST